MSLLQQLTSDMVSAMKNRDKETLNVVRMLKAAVQNEQIELGHDLNSNEEIAVMAREYKQRKESLDEFEKADFNLVSGYNSGNIGKTHVDIAKVNGDKMPTISCYVDSNGNITATSPATE